MISLGGASSCSTSGIDWDPEFHKASSVRESITNRHNVEIKCSEPRFDEFACLSRDKIKELAEILKRARMPKGDKDKALSVLNSALERL